VFSRLFRECSGTQGAPEERVRADDHFRRQRVADVAARVAVREERVELEVIDDSCAPLSVLERDRRSVDAGLDVLGPQGKP